MTNYRSRHYWFCLWLTQLSSPLDNYYFVSLDLCESFLFNIYIYIAKLFFGEQYLVSESILSKQWSSLSCYIWLTSGFCFQVEAIEEMPRSYFGEGLTLLGDRWGIFFFFFGKFFILPFKLQLLFGINIDESLSWIFCFCELTFQ